MIALVVDLAEKQFALIEAKTENLKTAKRMEELYMEAMEAMKSYRGTD